MVPDVNAILRRTLLVLLPWSVVAFVAAMLIVATGRDPASTAVAILRNGFGDIRGLTDSLTRMIPVLLCGLAAALPARAGLFNIGAEGQLHAGAIGATAVALSAQWLPTVLVIPLVLLLACLCGASLGAIPALLRTRWGVSEVLVALMLNYVMILLVEYLVHGPWRDPGALGWPYTAPFPSAAVLPSLGNTYVHMGLVIACLMAVGFWFILRSTTWGFGMRLMEANLQVARNARVPFIAITFALMAVGAALAGVAGAGEVSVVQGRLRPGISPGFGYAGFMVAWLSGNHPLVLVPVSFLAAGLYVGADALQLTVGLPSAAGDVFMGFVFIAAFLSRERLNLGVGSPLRA